ncbi:uncharacterized protein K441DRAFT_658432 [Cenococcum geophilum 1.58]|uniref:uncharacterized protein n=1 Tax=Cenococcum geophilum 1.58 TaxID=794803 RepID=UPI00358FA7BC|nr:hypothetical protein K441DRAFT_658432 [Cenococcum geophilum 1.58]
MPSGILWVASRVKQPGLTPEKFCSWYENVHIHEVTALSGAPRAAHYEGIKPSPFPGTLSSGTSWLTVYEMPDMNFRETKEFRSLDGQSEPEKELLEGVFKQARFDTRFYECIHVHEKEGGAAKDPGSLIISGALTPAEGTDADFDDWYREEHLPLIEKVPGYRRARRFKVVNATVLDEFKRLEPQIPTWLVLYEFDGKELPAADLKRANETEWSKKIIEGLQMAEPGFYRLKRMYDTEKEGNL